MGIQRAVISVQVVVRLYRQVIQEQIWVGLYIQLLKGDLLCFFDFYDLKTLL